MFTGKFPAGATAFKSNIHNINLGLIGLFPAALAFTPERKVINSFAYPLAWVG
jgi:hypothetical protein